MHTTKEPLVLLLPSMIDVLEVSYRSQIPFLKQHGFNPVLIEYPAKGFSIELLKEQIKNIVYSQHLKNNKVYLIGISFGATVIIDILANDASLAKQIDKVILFGAVFSYDDIGRKSRLGAKAFKTADKFVGKIFQSTFPIGRRFVKFSFDPKEQKTNKVSKDFDLSPLPDRLRYFFSRPRVESLPKINNVEALFLWWDKDICLTQRREVISSVFKNHKTGKISGIHGWMTTPAQAINSEILSFLLKN